jgi:plastocyanin
MRFAAAVVAAIAALASVAQAVDKRDTYQTSVPYYNNAPTASSSAAGPSTTHYVTVGGSAGLVYTPEYISANVNDVVVFNFGIHNHTVTQSTFAQPCLKTQGGSRLP